ncbi:MAG TPA: ABC transporter ATP-binding protein [Candidatus Dormibacteraeota bacterium]|nr:ABC transporter ATP-binding protein [Candidatus Dormibacteraeota bacterium]
MSDVGISGLSVTYGATRAVNALDLEVAEGEWLTLVGPNGAGKSSILRALARLTPYAGRIEIGREDVARLAGRQLARRVAIVLQVPHMPAGMTVAQYVMLGRSPHLGYLGRERPRDVEVVAEVLKRLSLDAFAGRTLDQLSGGERQRAAIGRALAQEAPVLLIDEPTSSLDISRQQEVLELIDEVRASRGLTVIAAMHDLTLAGQYADRLALLVDGRLVMAGRPDEVLTEPVISNHYGAKVHVIRDGSDTPAVLPVRARKSKDPA